MAKLILDAPVQERPYKEWATVAVELIGAETRMIKGAQYTHRVIEMGDGPPVFLLHGAGGYAETYARTMPMLAEHFHCYAPDMLYHGFSSKPAYDPSNWVPVIGDGILDLMDALGHERAHLVGESLGGGVASGIGLRHPERCNKLVLNGFNFKSDRKFKDNGTPPGELFDLSLKALDDPTEENVRKRLEWLVAKPDRIDLEQVKLRQRIWSIPEVNASLRNVFNIGGEPWGNSPKPQDESVWRNDFEPGSRSLILWGEHNPHRGYDFAEYGAEVIGGQFYGIDDAGHWPQWEHPDEWVQAVTQFLLA